MIDDLVLAEGGGYDGPVGAFQFEAHLVVVQFAEVFLFMRQELLAEVLFE